MAYERLAYDDQDSTLQMHLDCTACTARIRLPQPRIAPELMAAVPALEYDALPREVRKPEITVTEAAAHLAARLHLHLD